jgi:hypothetical protein
VWVIKTFAIRKTCVAKSYPDNGSAVSQRLKNLKNKYWLSDRLLTSELGNNYFQTVN